MEYLTQEEIQLIILSAYDSFNFITELQAIESLTTEQLDSLERNKQHLLIMLEKDWFTNELTLAQKSELESVI